ncbi:MAG: hypothetical protein M0P59_09290 [Gallionella sp.]|jgi:hypothetical protein|nr:hypothetical protein [Gallionella sp.]MCK9354338.1 hypothetical protein [Gallionella sp.]
MMALSRYAGLFNCLDSGLMELLAIRLSWQTTPAKSLVMRRNDAALCQWITFIENTAGFYFFRPYNARLAAAIAALVHRYLTYLSRVFQSRLSKELPGFLRVSRLATMFYAPVNLPPYIQGVVFCLRLPFS